MWNEELVIADVHNDTEPSDADDQVESDNEVIIGEHMYTGQRRSVATGNTDIQMMRLQIELKEKEIQLLQAQQRAQMSQQYFDVDGNYDMFSSALREVKPLLPKMSETDDDVLCFFRVMRRFLLCMVLIKDFGISLCRHSLLRNHSKSFQGLAWNRALTMTLLSRLY